MGSGDLSTKKNAVIYSGLGLDISPSSSLDQSPSESEGMYQESQEPLSESPTSILRVNPPLFVDLLINIFLHLMYKKSRTDEIFSLDFLSSL